MKILVIGNGFDLAHYLPTSYNHFMSVMQAIENLPDGKDEIGFDDLFGELAEKEKWFFDRTRKLYSTESMNFSFKAINTIKEKLKENSWYSYFKQHLAEIETWIDFETKVGEAVEIFSNLHDSFYAKKKENDSSFTPLMVNSSGQKGVYLNAINFDCLSIFKVIQGKSDSYRFGFDLRHEYVDHKYKELKFDKIIRDLKSDLDNFIGIFDTYLSLIVSEFKLKESFLSFDKVFDNLEFIYSFNYTSTFSNLYTHYQGKVKVEYLHGQAGNSDKKIVLGISELPSEVLMQHKAYGFVKYHQKLFNNTDYQFLSENQKAQDLIYNFTNTRNHIEAVEVVIWGHSLDESDQEYIKEIFSFNNEKLSQGPVKVKIFFHNEASRFAQIANLLHILGKTLVERWMKKGWLKFEPVPDIYELNRIQ